VSNLGPLTLTGRAIRLEPVCAQHRDGLAAAAGFPEIWRHTEGGGLVVGPNPEGLVTARDVELSIAGSLEAQRVGSSYAFTVVAIGDGRVLGSTRYLDVDEARKTVEVGATWYRPDCWGTTVNPESKLLLLQHAFESWKAIRVCFKTDVLNLHSQAAIQKLGAVYEGILRHDRRRRDGSLRDTAVFSVVESEWPAVRAALEARIASL
jgi:RimJ/RimL family protein N-acetyltransferase